MEPFVSVANIWKPWNIFSKGFQFWSSKDPGSASNITIQVMWICFMTPLHLHQPSTAWLTLLLLLSCSVLLLSSSLKNSSWRESLSGSNGKPSTVTELLSSIFKNEILKASIFYQHKIIQQNIFYKQILFIYSKSFTGCCHQIQYF